MRYQYIFFKHSELKVFKALKEFGHVFIVKINHNAVIKIDPLATGLDIEVINNKILRLYKKQYKYVLIHINDNSLQLGLPMLKTCVGVAKSLLGINNPFILTPKQLYNYLLKERERSYVTKHIPN